MNIAEVHAELAAAGVFLKADDFDNAVSDLQVGYEEVVKQLKACYSAHAKEAKTEPELAYIESIKFAFESLEAAVDMVDDSRRDFRYAIQRIEESLPVVRRKPLPNEAYQKPIIDALVALGGSAKAGDVLDQVGRLMASELQEQDLALLQSNSEPRWRKSAQWARREMVLKGLLRDDAPRGHWELSAQGRELAEN